MTIFDLFCRLPAIDCGDGWEHMSGPHW